MEFLAAILPDALSAPAALLLIFASFFTSALTAVFGLGGGMAMLALLGLFTPVAALIPVHGAVQLGSNTGRAWHQRAHILRGIATPSSSAASSGPLWARFSSCSFPMQC